MSRSGRLGSTITAAASVVFGMLFAGGRAPAEEDGIPPQVGPPKALRRIPEREFVWRGSISVLVYIPAVRDELRISPELYEKIKTAQEQAASFYEMQQVHQRIRVANQDWQEALRSRDKDAILLAGRNLDEARAIEANDDASKDKATRSLLTEAQSRRLFQISVQQEGARALLRPEAAEQLGLSDDQRLQLQNVMAALQAERDALRERIEADPAVQKRAARVREIVEKSRNGARPPDDDLQFLAESWKRGELTTREYDRLDERADDRLMKVLTRYQRQGLNRLRGPDFDLRLLTRDAESATTNPR
jgi:hypothetical protein